VIPTPRSIPWQPALTVYDTLDRAKTALNINIGACQYHRQKISSYYMKIHFTPENSLKL
jgi:hypothetical protein